MCDSVSTVRAGSVCPVWGIANHSGSRLESPAVKVLGRQAVDRISGLSIARRGVASVESSKRITLASDSA